MMRENLERNRHDTEEFLLEKERSLISNLGAKVGSYLSPWDSCTQVGRGRGHGCTF